MQGLVTNLLGATVRLKNGLEGKVCAVAGSSSGFGLALTLLKTDGTFQEAHSGEVVECRLAEGAAEKVAISGVSVPIERLSAPGVPVPPERKKG